MADRVIGPNLLKDEEGEYVKRTEVSTVRCLEVLFDLGYKNKPPILYLYTGNT